MEQVDQQGIVWRLLPLAVFFVPISTPGSRQKTWGNVSVTFDWDNLKNIRERLN